MSNKVKQIYYKIISINSLFIIYNVFNDFSTIFKIVGKEKCGHHDLLYRRITKVGRKVGVQAATFLTGLPLWMIQTDRSSDKAFPLKNPDSVSVSLMKISPKGDH